MIDVTAHKMMEFLRERFQEHKESRERNAYFGDRQLEWFADQIERRRNQDDDQDDIITVLEGYELEINEMKEELA